MDLASQATPPDRWRLAWWLTLVAGTLMQVWFWLRSVWIYLDQVELYELGLALARGGPLSPFGKLSTANLPIPGVFLQLLVGGPLLAWFDVRSPTLVLLAFHLAAALILSWLLARDFGWRVATLFLAVFWLSPWRLFHSGFLWETNYLMLPAALHLAACRASFPGPRFAPSALLGATLALTFQLHGSVLILVLSSLLLALRGRMRLHWGGLTLGTIVGSLTLVPTLLAWLTGSGLSARPDSAAGIVARLNSVEKGLVYWFRLSSLDIGRRFRQSLFCLEPGGGNVPPTQWLCYLVELTQVLALASVVISLMACWWFFWRQRHTWQDGAPPHLEAWYRHYSLSILIAIAISALVSPVLLQGWHVLIALPAACLPIAFWIAARWPTASTALRSVILLFVLWRVPASLLLLGHPMYARPTAPEIPRHIAPLELRDLLPDS